MTIDMEQFKATYIEESLEGLDVMESTLLNLSPGDTDDDAINLIFRAAHSIKGGGGTFGFNEVSNFTHVVETLLDEIRCGDREITQEAIFLFLQSVDCIREMLAASQSGEPLDEEGIEELRLNLQAMLDTKPGVAADNIDNGVSGESNAGNSESGNTWNIKFKPHPDMLSTGNDVVRMFRELNELGEMRVDVNLERLPVLSNVQPDESYLEWNVHLEAECELKDIQDVFLWVEDECDLEITSENSTVEAPVVANVRDDHVSTDSEFEPPTQVPVTDASKPVEANKAKAKVSTSKESSSIRVDIEKIDALINMVGELVITQSMLTQLGEDFEMDRLEKMLDGISQLERNTRELQESVMRIRMIPISFAFNRFPRMIHDMCNKFGKKVELKLSGEATELDKTVMEKIGDPLVHLVRNAMDHGIEMPEVRKANGKSETGTLHLNAFHQGGNIVIEIKDDGAGLNRSRIMSKAVERGLVEPGVELSDARIYDLLFLPGFSTAEKITDVSGRGVGMDVVRKNIQALGGSVEVNSEDGKGTTFTVRLPLTLAILDGQLVRVGEHIYIIPLVSIIESLQVRREYVNAIAGKAELYQLRDEYIPIVRLYRAFDVEPSSNELVNGLLVVVEGDGQKAGILVDDLLAQQQVVIKSLETNFKRVEGLSGATILGDGKVALIVDVAGIIRLSNSAHPEYSYRCAGKEIAA
ncbi:MAG: chemotaxis protein CheA [Gammaproteobacteria bacterium]|nr:chemotaxis protein CheA [Gammaproteobacteria bacterium]MDH5802656.1 chemotaxis protein CheA [Gammaproteobacteria bacterium]